MSGAASLPEKVLSVDRALADARIPHAFGGALALAYYAEPRATIDIDLNAFLEPSKWRRVEAALGPLGVKGSEDPAALERDGQARWWWGRAPVDLFFANDPIHEAMRERARRVPFGEERIPILAPEHLLVCKVAYDRAKDWIDVEQMVFLEPDLDRAEVERWLDRHLAPGDERRLRVAELLERAEP